MNTTLIACPIGSFSELKYQMVLRQEKGKLRLNSVNIIIGKKIIKKIKKEDTIKRFIPSNYENIAIDYLTKHIVEEKDSKTKKAKPKTSKSAKMKAANDLMNTFNL